MKTSYIVGAFVLAIGIFTVWRFAFAPSSSEEKLMQSIQSGEEGVKASTTEKVSEEVKSQKVISQNNSQSMHATLHTSKGDITLEFNASEAPNTVANFVKLAKTGFYDGVKFHRVIKGFMIQGGDPLTKDDSAMARWGTGGPGYTFEDELGPDNHNNEGTISMANAGPDTNGSQFFINVANNNFLDTKHTVFGKVTSGMDVVHAIENTPTGPNDRPVEAVVINSVSF